MATIINTPNPDPTRVVQVERTDSSGWAIAVIVLVLVIAGLFWWVHYRGAAVPAPADNTPAQGGAASVNVTIPTGGTDDNGGDTSGASGGASGSGGATTNP